MSGGVSHHQSEYLGAIAMKVAVASDHRGYHLKEKVIALLKSKGHEVLDEGPATDESVDYPDFAALVASKVSANAVDRGVLICGTGLGMAIAANKFPRVRAAACVDEVTAELSRRHNDVNVLCLSGDLLSSWKSGWAPSSRGAGTSVAWTKSSNSNAKIAATETHRVTKLSSRSRRPIARAAPAS
jgi:ribose 5-phosphate isomerase B